MEEEDEYVNGKQKRKYIIKRDNEIEKKRGK